MKRFHVHLHVDNLAQSVAFYSRLFDAEPSRLEADYAKWMLDDPRVNFAISTRGDTAGIDHLGIQAENPAELLELRARAAVASSAGADILDEGQTQCCYSVSDKHWITDPQGIAWEHYQTLDSIPVFGKRPEEAQASPCCAAGAHVAAKPLCTPGAKPAGSQSCC